MHDHEPAPQPWARHLSSGPNGGVGPARSFELLDLTVANSEGLRLRRALVAAHIELALPPDGVAIHESLVASVRDHLSGREALVWQDRDRFNMSFGAFAHAERDQVEAFAESVARALGATIVFATTVGMVVPADASFLN